MYKHRLLTDKEVLNSSIVMRESYTDFRTIPEIVNNLILYRTISKRGTQVCIYVDDSEGTIYVAFRGTSAPGDVVTDISYFPKDYLDTKSHSGFIKAFENVETEIVSYVNTIIRNSKINKLIFCGHSLGGAAAQIAFYFANYYELIFAIELEKIFCVTEGSPQVFVQRKLTATHSAFEERAIRITYADDIVPKLPPRTLILTLMRREYTHIGQHWNMGISDNKGDFKEHSSAAYLALLKKEVEEHEGR